MIEAGRPLEQLTEEGLVDKLAAYRPVTAADAVALAEAVAEDAQKGAEKEDQKEPIMRDDIALIAVRVRAPVAALA